MQEARDDQSPESTLEAHDDARIQGPARIADCRLSPTDDKSLSPVLPPSFHIHNSTITGAVAEKTVAHWFVYIETTTIINPPDQAFPI
jgi:hypothetical protein